MLRHVVMFRWTDDVDDAHVAAITGALSALPACIPSIRAYRFGADVAVNDGNFDFVVTADFDDVDGYVAYRDHPEHLAMIDRLIKGHVAERAAVQFEAGA